MRRKDRLSGASLEHTRLKPQLLSATGENVRLGCKIQGLPHRGGSVSARGETRRCGGLQVREGRKTTILLKAKTCQMGQTQKKEQNLASQTVGDSGVNRSGQSGEWRPLWPRAGCRGHLCPTAQTTLRCRVPGSVRAIMSPHESAFLSYEVPSAQASSHHSRHPTGKRVQPWDRTSA